jgi:hypothetical protein
MPELRRKNSTVLSESASRYLRVLTRFQTNAAIVMFEKEGRTRELWQKEYLPVSV